MRKQFNKRGLGGFTIIEVIIVLAIAGLIMVVVFLAVPQLQKNSRDSARKAVVSRLKSEIENYASNNGGTYPFNNVTVAGSTTSGDWCDFYTRYVTNANLNIKDPSTNTNVIACPTTASPNATQSGIAAYGAQAMPGNRGVLAIFTGARCNGESVTANAGVTNSYAMVIGLDRTGTRFCVDNG